MCSCDRSKRRRNTDLNRQCVQDANGAGKPVALGVRGVRAVQWSESRERLVVAIAEITSLKPELLAPAGDRTCLIAAVENGADAVYFGLRGHNARARAVNFDIDELPE